MRSEWLATAELVSSLVVVSDPQQIGGRRHLSLSELQDLEQKTCSEMRYLTVFTLICLQSGAEIQIRLCQLVTKGSRPYKAEAQRLQ